MPTYSHLYEILAFAQEPLRRQFVQEALPEQSSRQRMPCQRALIVEDHAQNLIRLCNQFGVATRAFLTTSTGGAELFSHRTGNRLRQTISISDLRANFWIANIGPSNPRFKELQINGHFLTAFRCLEFIANTSTSMRECQHADTRWTTGTASCTATNAIFHLASPIFFPLNRFDFVLMTGTIWQVLCS